MIPYVIKIYMVSNFKINYVGIVVDSKDLHKFESASVAGNKMQLGIIKGLHALNKEIEVTSSFPHKMFTGKGKFLISGKKTIFGNTINAQYISYINFIYLKQITIFIGYLSSLLIWCVKNRGKKILIVYNTISYIALPVLITSKIFKCKTVCIIADLPIQYSKKSLFERFENCIEISLINKFDGLIVLTEQIQKDFAPNRPYIVVEAGIEPTHAIENATEPLKIDDIKKIVFTGTLNSLSGIELLLEAFLKIKSSKFQLHIYGAGEKESIVNDYAKIDNRIYFHGRVDNERILEIQKKSDLLVSPRPIDDYVTKYTFPSKVLEYISNGRPVLSNKLLGIPKDYDDLINFAESSNTDDWAKMILKILNNETGLYLEKAIKAKLTVEKNKTWANQSKRIYDFILNISESNNK